MLTNIDLMERVVSLLHLAGISTMEKLAEAYEENKTLVSSLAEQWAE